MKEPLIRGVTATIKPLWIVLGLALVYTVFLTTLSIVQHQGLKTQMNDLGNADQALWAAASGDLAMTQSNDLDGKLRSRIGVHANLIFYLLSLFYLVWPDPKLLLVLTSLACAAAGGGLYAIARQRLGNTWWAVVPAVAFWMSPIVHDSNLFDFHIITVATALLVWTFWAFDAGRPKTAWILLVLSLLCSEDIALVTLMLGFYLSLSRSHRTGFLVMGLSLLYFLTVLYIFVPAFNEGHGLSKLEGLGNRYSWLGANHAEIFTAILNKPGMVLNHILQPDRLRLPFYLLLCGGIAGFGAWRVLIMSLPQITAALLANGIWMTRITGTYYWIISEAIIVVACILSAERRIRNNPGKFPYQLAYLGVATLVLSILFSPLPHGIFFSWKNYSLPPERLTLQDMVRIIPRDAAVCVQNNLGPHLSQRRDIAAFPRRCDKAEYALFHLRYVGGPDTGLFVRSSPLLLTISPQDLSSVVRGMLVSQEWVIVYQKAGFYLFARHAQSRIDYEHALHQFDIDYKMLENSYHEASRHQWPWSPYLTKKFTWDQLKRAGKECRPGFN